MYETEEIKGGYVIPQQFPPCLVPDNNTFLISTDIIPIFFILQFDVVLVLYILLYICFRNMSGKLFSNPSVHCMLLCTSIPRTSLKCLHFLFIELQYKH